MACACGLAFYNVSYWRLYFKKEFGHWVQTGLAVYRVMVASVGLGCVFTGSRASRGKPVPFWFIKLFIEVFVLNFASPKSLLQSIKILSIMKPPLWCWDCGLNVFMSSDLLCFLLSWLLRLREAPCKHVFRAAPYPPATRLLLLWYCCLSLSLRFSHLPSWPPARVPVLGRGGLSLRRSFAPRAFHCWTVRVCKVWSLETNVRDLVSEL